MNTLLPPFRELLERLIALPSVSSADGRLDMSNRRVIHLLAGWLGDLGFRVEEKALAGDKANLVAVLGGGPGGLVLAGHTDTVPWDDALWTSDPFRLAERNGRFYGLGTSDMKAFFAVALEALRDVREQDLTHPVIVLATADEETSMAGAKALTGYPLLHNRAAVIGEPTALKPVRMHKGMMMEAIRVVGRSGHSSDPALGNNALEGMQRVMGALLRWRGELQAAHREPLFKVPHPTLNLGHIHGGDNPNRICGQCELHIDLRPTPGLGVDALRREMQQRVADALAGSGLELVFEPLFDGIPAFATDGAAAIVKAAEEFSRAPAEAAAFATEAPYLSALGTPTVVLGPGDIRQAHQPDEYLAMENVTPMVDILRGLVRCFCMT
ncbi:MAG: acetylornithine deacetylase [Gammaproteobacteria bacterium]|nr:acetylornithine deacetylase [Gammaproteobacteria bacterium]